MGEKRSRSSRKAEHQRKGCPTGGGRWFAWTTHDGTITAALHKPCMCLHLDGIVSN